MTVGLRPAVHGIMLRRGNRFEIFGMISLQAPDEGHAKPAHVEGVLAVCLHAPPPPGIAEDVDVRRPEGQTLIDASLSVPQELMILGPRFIGDHRSHAMHQLRIPCRPQADGLRKNRSRARPGYTVQTLVPPVVFGDAETLHSRCAITHLADFLFQRHTIHQIVYAFFDG